MSESERVGFTESAGIIGDLAQGDLYKYAHMAVTHLVFAGMACDISIVLTIAACACTYLHNLNGSTGLRPHHSRQIGGGPGRATGTYVNIAIILKWGQNKRSGLLFPKR